MALWQEKNGILTPHKFGYDAIKDTTKRRSPATSIKSEDQVLQTQNRNKLSGTIHDQERNFSLMAWAIRKHISYVTTHKFRSLTGNETFDARLEELMKWWSNKNNCDIAGKHSLQKIIDIAEGSRVKDGDVFLMKLKSGHLQAIESDRINTASDIPESFKKRNWVSGVALNKNTNRATLYCVTKRAKWGGSYSFEKIVKAENMLTLGYYGRFDQVRGVSPLSSAVNTMQDLYEAFDANLIKSKMAAMFGIAIERELPDTTTDFEYTDTGDFELKTGLKLELDPGESVNVIESKNPSTEFQSYSELMTRVAILSLDIPYTYFDSRRSSFSAMRQDRIEYEQATREKQTDIRELLNEITNWKISQWSSTGILSLPGGASVSQIRYAWIPKRIPLLDPAKEYAAFEKAIELGIKSRKQIAAELGLEDWEDTIEQLAIEKKIMDANGLIKDKTGAQ